MRREDDKNKFEFLLEKKNISKHKIPLEKPLMIQASITYVGDVGIYAWDMLEFDKDNNTHQTLKEQLLLIRR